MYESDAIIKYLFTEYGDGQVPLALRLGFATTLTCGLALAPRAGAGTRASPSKQPAEPLVLWGYELSPFVVLVKEKLSELELPYKQVSSGYSEALWQSIHTAAIGGMAWQSQVQGCIAVAHQPLRCLCSVFSLLEGLRQISGNPLAS
eukprot:GHUV01027127.1.p1 GENE.GHUV01027127.1~~GHUV01027127.1.p1  ORF type:complete len:147 (+),score=33.12 GHUV01027127.1:737-1177(+)